MVVRGGGDDSKRELTELSKQHQVSRTRAERLAQEMEHGNKALLELLESYRRADAAYDESRKR